MRKLPVFSLFAALVLTPALITSISYADSPKAKGTITGVDVESLSITLKVKKRSLKLILNEATVIVRNGDSAALADLAEGDRATAYYDPSTMLAERVEARGEVRPNRARIEGTISAVDSGALTVTIAPIREGSPVTLNVIPETSITLNGGPATLDELQTGFNAAAAYDPGTFNAARINAESYAEVRGTVRDASATEHRVTIGTASGDELTLNVTDKTSISLNGRPAALEDLHRGFQVVAVYVRASLTAVRIAATSLGDVTGHIRSVDISSATVVIMPLVEGAALELHVGHSTVIKIGDQPGSLDQLRAGMAAHAVFDIVSLEAIALEARPVTGGDECTLVRVAGTVARVNLDEQTLTIDPADSHELVTIIVVERTEITLEGRPARLSDLKPGMHAEAGVCRENLIAKAVLARSAEPTVCSSTARVTGKIASINLDEHTLAIATPEAANPLVLNVVERTVITVDSHPARLADLEVGMGVEAGFCRETSTALVLVARTIDPACTPARVTGTIARVDVENGTVTLAVSAAAAPLTVSVNDRTEITVNGQPARLSDLRPEMRAEAAICRESLVAKSIDARTPSTSR